MSLDAIKRTDALEAALMARISSVYADALNAAVKKRAAFLRKIEALDKGQIKPPKYYVDTDQVAKWREGFIKELIRQDEVIEGIMQEINKAGETAAEIIRDTMTDVYVVNEAEAVDLLNDGIKRTGSGERLMKHTREQVKILMQQQESPFSKLAYMNLGSNLAIRRRLQNELAQATILGEDQRQLIKRIRAVTGQAEWQARRVAQTERTRVQSQARWNQGNDATAMGIRVYNEWSTRMINSRDTHVELDGKCAMQGEYFPGSPLRYPGDPTAPAGEVINCHCVMIPGVLLGGQDVKDGKVVGREASEEEQRGAPAFEPAATIEEAEAFARTFTSKHRDWDGPCSYKGIDLEYANEMNRAMNDVFTAYAPDTKLRSIQPFNRRKAVFKDTTAEAAYQWSLNDLYYNKDYYKSKKAFQEHKKQYDELLKTVIPKLDVVIEKTKQESGYMAKSKLMYYEALKKTGRTNVTPPDAYGTVIHEMGHFLDDVAFGRSYRKDHFDIKASYEKYSSGISAYATANRQEYVAESFTAWWFGETDILDPKLVEYFEKGRV